MYRSLGAIRSAVLASVALAVSSCPTQTAAPDIGPDGRADAGDDADLIDAPMDVGVPADDVGFAADARDAPALDAEDAATFWREPAFVPRRIYRASGVVCEPQPPLVYMGMPRDPAPPGTVLWNEGVSATVRDEIVRVLPPGESLAWSSIPFTGSPTGGFTAYGVSQVEVAFGADGAFEYARRLVFDGVADELPLARVDGERGTLSASATTQTLSLLGTASGLRVRVDPPLPEPRMSDPNWINQIELSMPAVMHERGRVVWHAGYNAIVSTCLADGVTEWVVEYDVPERRPNAGWELRALSDGSVIAGAGYDLVRIDADGVVVAQRRDPLVHVAGMSEECGLATYTGDSGRAGRVEWLDPTDLTTVASRSLESLFVGGITSTGDVYLLTDCSVLTSALRTFRDYYMARVSRDGLADGPLVGFPGGGVLDFTPLDDGGVLTLDYGHRRVLVWNGDGTLRWEAPVLSADPSAVWLTSGVLMPNGTLYSAVATASGTRFLAIAVGAGPGPLHASFSGVNWARTGAPLP